MTDAQFRCFVVEKDGAGNIAGHVTSRNRDDLPPGDVTIRVAWSSLNYKDALAASGHGGIVRKFPHVPGIDAAGEVVESSAPEYPAGTQVLVTGHELGSGRWGGWSELIRVPAEWVVPLPTGLSLRESMIFGTAGFTAAQCVAALQLNGVKPDSGEVVVTGATGGVGCLSVMLLGKLGYQVVAVTGKPELSERLRAWGAKRILRREDVISDSPKPLLTASWAGAVDTVGGATLATLLRATQLDGCVAACGLVGGVELALTVYPFILRGVTLAGIDSGSCPRGPRLEIWRRLAGEWKPEGLESLVTVTGLDSVSEHVQSMLRGQVSGRVLVQPV